VRPETTVAFEGDAETVTALLLPPKAEVPPPPQPARRIKPGNTSSESKFKLKSGARHRLRQRVNATIRRSESLRVRQPGKDGGGHLTLVILKQSSKPGSKLEERPEEAEPKTSNAGSKQLYRLTATDLTNW
jgi:hypothetical protein